LSFIAGPGIPMRGGSSLIPWRARGFLDAIMRQERS
jgi:hypothetical protein